MRSGSVREKSAGAASAELSVHASRSSLMAPSRAQPTQDRRVSNTRVEDADRQLAAPPVLKEAATSGSSSVR